MINAGVNMKNPFGIVTRKCRKSDHDFVYMLVKQLKPYVARFAKWDKKYFDDSFSKTYADMIVLMKGARRIGMFQLVHENSYTYIMRIYLSRSYQNKGIGSFLVDYFEKIAEKKAKKRIRLHVWQGNPAVKFYRKLGYKVIKKEPGKYLMEKRI